MNNVAVAQPAAVRKVAQVVIELELIYLNLILKEDRVDQFQPIMKFLFERREYTQLGMCV
jgi:hypothetical protein